MPKKKVTKSEKSKLIKEVKNIRKRSSFDISNSELSRISKELTIVEKKLGIQY